MGLSIYPIHMGLDTVYAIRGESVILIDGGDPHKVETFKKGVENASIRPEEIQLIVLTHGHWDHIGSTKDIKELTGAKVLMHQKDMHFLEETSPSQPPGLTTWGKISTGLVKLISPFIHISKFEVDMVTGDDEISLSEYSIPGKVVPTPGHSWGSVSVLLDSGEGFVGDLAKNRIPIRLSPGLPIYGDDIQVVKESWRKLLDMGIKTVYPAHGKPFPAEVMRKAVA
jgi:glyoxylase-like metal-dependent hydrolase (beta-lactamase superfamily II)